MGKESETLSHINEDWGNWVQKGYTTWPETWQMETITSLCHGWSSTPSYDLMVDVLGIRLLKPGFKTFLIKPVLAGLTFAKGACPTQFGSIIIEWKLSKKEFILSLEVPPGSRAKIELPINELPGSHILLNGKTINAYSFWLKAGNHIIIAD